MEGRRRKASSALRCFSDMPKISDIIGALEEFAPLSLQESYDNCGLQTGDASRECTGVMLCVDPTPGVIAEAASAGCNLVVSHHPLIFRGLKHITGSTPVERAVEYSIRNGVAVYSLHTCLDNAPSGVSRRMAEMLGLTQVTALDCESGAGAVGQLAEPLAAVDFLSEVKRAFGARVVRHSVPDGSRMVSRVALCGGSGASMLPAAVACGADAMVTADVKYHDFADYGGNILIADIGHFESEHCTIGIFTDIITKKFPNFAVRDSHVESNPVNYM